MTTIICTGNDNVARTFEYEHIFNDSEAVPYHLFRVFSLPKSNDFYSMEISKSLNGKFIITSIANNSDPALKGKGITEKMIQEARTILGQSIWSSSNRGHKFFETEWRSEPATKIWERLVKKKLASYDPINDRYCFH